ncbi:MAG: FTR1 family protein [Candidatus Bathyarchaeota archaeon]|nr:MAG: FTR1 family protein [Candidatus Bathyarchaeota archaeon]
MIASFLITFREALEAALIVSIIMAYLAKVGRKDFQKYLYLGTILAVVVSLFLGWGVIAFYGSLSTNAERIFEGAASVTATAVLTYMIFWMAKNASTIRSELQEKVDIAVTTGYVFGITTLAFVSVFREGLETVLFLTALSVTDPIGTISGAVLGIGTVLLLAYLMMKGIYRMNIQKFFKYTSVILVIFAAGLLGYGVHEFIEAGLLPPIIEHVWDINPIDVTHPLHEKGVIGSILKALVGYDGNPELLRVIVYVGYWLVIGYYLLRTYAPSYIPWNRNKVAEKERKKLEQIKIP